MCAWVAVAGAAIGAAPAIFKGISGMGQTSKANGMNPVNPGYTMNRGVIDNAKTLSDQYGNFQLPGYSQMAGNIDTSFQNSFDTGKQGATSSADLLDLATRMAYGKNQAFNNLGVQNAQGKQSMLGAYLSGNAAAGQEYVNKNAYDREMYDGQVKEKAALTQAGASNTYGALDQLAGTASKFAFSKAGATAGGNGGVDGETPYGDATAYTANAFNKRFYPDGSPRFDAIGRPLPAPASSGVPATSIY